MAAESMHAKSSIVAKAFALLVIPCLPSPLSGYKVTLLPRSVNAAWTLDTAPPFPASVFTSVRPADPDATAYGFASLSPETGFGSRRKPTALRPQDQSHRHWSYVARPVKPVALAQTRLLVTETLGIKFDNRSWLSPSALVVWCNV